MNCTAFFLLACCLQVAGTGLSQTVTLNLKNVRLDKAFREIEKQSGFSFVYGKEQLVNAKPVSLTITDASIETALQLVFNNQPLTYIISGPYISIKQKQEVQLAATSFVLPPLLVKGKITTEAGNPVEGATISVKGTNQGTQTATDGTFSITVPKENSVLVVSSVGYDIRTIQLSGKADIGNIVLQVSNKKLDEIVVVGYTSQRRKDITGAVAVVNTNDLKAVPSPNITQQLQGRASGVTVLLNGTPGVPAKVRVRGLGSFTNNSPLYVVDGVQTTDVSSLNPNDIESMQVLKDAASAAIYGVRSSNGVIVVTTKKGRKGSLNVSYDMTYGLQLPGKGFSKYVLSPQEQADYAWLTLRNSGLTTAGGVYGNGSTPVLPDYLFAGFSGTNGTPGPLLEGNPAVDPAKYSFDPTRIGDDGYRPYLIVKANKAGTNWWDLTTRNAPIQSHNLTLSGGGDNSRFLLSMNYFNQQAITVFQFYKRYSARLNSEFTVFKNIRFGENLQISSSEANVQGNTAGGNQSNNQEASDIGYAGQATIVPQYTISGTEYAGSAGGWGGTNPVATLYYKRNNRDNNIRLFGNLYGEADFLKHFTFRSSIGGYINTQNGFSYPLIEYGNSLNRNVPTYSENYVRSNRWVFTNQLSYKNEFGKHSVSALVGTEAIKDAGRQLITSTSGFYSYAYPNYINGANGATPNLSGSGTFTPVANSSMFASVNYAFDNKYLVSGLVRRDGSSKFLEPNIYGVFPAFSLGWRISAENFMKNATWLNDLKIRGSYGKLGNEAALPATNAYTTFTNSPSSSYYDLSGTQNTPQQGFYQNFVGNPVGNWEESVTANFGFDLTFLNNTTNVVFDYYTKETKKLLFNPGGQALLGAAASSNPSYKNVGSMKNHGIDLMITNRSGLTHDLTLTSSLTFTTYKNKITRVSDGATYFDYNSPSAEGNRLGGQTITRNMVGESLNSYYGYTVIGIFQDKAQVNAAPTQPGKAPGTFIYKDISGPNGKPDGVIDANDRSVIGNPNPDFTYGLNLDFEYKGFDLNAFFFGVYGKENYVWGKWFQDFAGNFGGSSKDAFYKSWLPDGSRPDATIPMQTTATSFSTSQAVNSFFVESASYFRLRNVQLGYTFKSSLLNKIKISKARVYIQATNLFTITKYSGLDPEVVTNDDRASGIDLNSYPTVKQISVGANISF